MLYEISIELAAEMDARKYPYAVVYGPSSNNSLVEPRIEMELALGAGLATHRPATHKPVNSKITEQVLDACIVRIFSKSSLEGASTRDHQRQCLTDRQTFMVSLRSVLTTRRNGLLYTSLGFLSDADIEQLEIVEWAGAVYEIQFQFSRAIYDRDWTEEDADTATIGENGLTVESTTEVDDHTGQDPVTC